MKPKELQTFNDGIVNIYTVGNIAEKGDAPKEGLTLNCTLKFDKKTVGIKRFYSALQNNIEINLLIRTHCKDVSAHDVAIINGQQYEIIQAQYPEDVYPKCMDLSLKKVVQKYDIAKP